jgi:hypothetical protein
MQEYIKAKIQDGNRSHTLISGLTLNQKMGEPVIQNAI